MDARIRYTKMAIKDAFIQLLSVQPLNKITVTMLCEIAQINRATFYKYYDDAFDLMKQIEAELILDMREMTEQAEITSVDDIFKMIVLKMKDKHDIYTVVCSENGDSQFVNQVFMLGYQLTLPTLDNRVSSLSSSEKEWFFFFMVKGFAGIMERWMVNGMPESPEMVAGFMSRLSKTLLEEYVTD